MRSGVSKRWGIHGEESLLSPTGFMVRGVNINSRAKCRCSVGAAPIGHKTPSVIQSL